MSKNKLRSSGEPRSGGFANGAGERGEVDTHAFLWVKQLKLVRVR